MFFATRLLQTLALEQGPKGNLELRVQKVEAGIIYNLAGRTWRNAAITR